jgi:O-succinylbenzoate synthase
VDGRAGVRLDEVELRRITLPLVAPFETSAGTQTGRDVLLVRARAGGVDGWGECVAGDAPVYTSEYTAAAHGVLRDHLLPRLFAAGALRAEDVAPTLAPVVGHRMAKAAVELAVLDLQLRLEARSLASYLGAGRDRVPVGVAIGIAADVGALVASAERHLAEGYVRLKVKVKPGWDLEPLRALRRAVGDGVPIQVDANAAYRLSDLPALQALDELGLLLIEQPLPEDQLLDHAVVAAALTTPVCLDESITSAAVARDALATGACSVVNIKPGRVGGHLAGRAIHDLCLAAGAGAWHGGMLETGIGRAANLALAALPGFTLPGDISAADRYWRRDIVTEPATLDPDGTIAVPDGPGIGVEVDHAVLEAATTSVEVVRPG